MTVPTSTDHTRRGRLHLARAPYETMQGRERIEFEKRFLVQRADLTQDGQSYIIYATSPLFDLVAPFEAAPFYTLINYVDLDKDTFIITARRDDDFTAKFDAAPPPIAETFTAPATVSTAEKRKAIERELGFRRRVYPKSVADGKMKQAEADHQIAVMEAILKDYAA